MGRGGAAACWMRRGSCLVLLPAGCAEGAAACWMRRGSCLVPLPRAHACVHTCGSELSHRSLGCSE